MTRVRQVSTIGNEATRKRALAVVDAKLARDRKRGVLSSVAPSVATPTMWCGHPESAIVKASEGSTTKGTTGTDAGRASGVRDVFVCSSCGGGT